LRPLFEKLTARYDVILIDAPPLLQVSDARSLSVLPEVAFLVVVRMMHTERKPLLLAMDALRTVGAEALGAVMNCADGSADAYYDCGYGYGYGEVQEGRGTEASRPSSSDENGRNASRIRAILARLFRV
jgi:Mrp family chromosome partitioning ATPase